MRPRVSFARQNFVHSVGGERGPPEGQAALVQNVSYRPDACTIHVIGKDLPNDLGVGRVDFELLLVRVATYLDRHCFIAERRPRPVPEASARIGFHRTRYVLGVLSALLLVKDRIDLPDHLPGAVVGDGLGYRDKRYVVLLQRPSVELKIERVAEEPRETVHKHRVEGTLFSRRIVHHALELRTLVVRRGCARLDVLSRDRPPFVPAPCFQPVALVGDRQVFFSLSSC